MPDGRKKERKYGYKNTRINQENRKDEIIMTPAGVNIFFLGIQCPSMRVASKLSETLSKKEY